METALTLVVLLAVAVAVRAFAEQRSASAPLLLILTGVVLSWVPFLEPIELTPDLVLIGLLPPLLYAAAIRTPLMDFRTNIRAIGLLSVGLVVFTAVGVGALAHWLLDVPWAVGLALGAVVAPPDAVAATAVAHKVGLPRQVVTILEGESLVNDATAIVVLRSSIAGIAGTVAAWEIGLGFVVSAVGGTAVGWVVATVVTRLRPRIHDEVTDVAVSLLTPWIAYIVAEEVHVPGLEAEASGVLAVVVAGLILGHRSPALQSGSSRLFERTNWATISYVLENAVFVLIGLQLRSIFAAVDAHPLPSAHITWMSLAVLAAVIVLRLVWVFAAASVPRVLVKRVSDRDPTPTWQATLLVAWAGMRGVVTLAAAFLLPQSTPEREVLIFIALVVTVGTLVLQGLTLPVLVRRLELPRRDLHEEYLQEATVFQAVTDAGLAYVDRKVVGTVSDDVLQRLRDRANNRTNAVWERLGGSETPTEQYSRARAGMLRAERAEVLRLRADGTLDQEVLARVLASLDVEESILDRLAENSSTADREVELRPTYDVSGLCAHLDEYRIVPNPRTPSGCEECLRDGTDWVHLRLCLDCGHVGCCDSSVGMHADRHFQETGHPVMRSFEPGEAWRWCYVDRVTG